jgi:hemerythrin
VNYINELCDAMHCVGSEKHETLVHVLDDLVDYTESHFSFEEAMLEDAGYPLLNAHKKMHELFIMRLNSYIRRFKAGEDITVELRDTLARWLINHIKTTDGSYVEYVKHLNKPLPKPRDAKTASLWTRLFGRNK